MRDSRRAHLPGGSIKLQRGQLDVHAKEEALEVGVTVFKWYLRAHVGWSWRLQSACGALVLLRLCAAARSPHAAPRCTARAACLRRTSLPGGCPLAPLGAAPQALPTAPTHNKPHKWAPFRPILENDNNGWVLLYCCSGGLCAGWKRAGWRSEEGVHSTGGLGCGGEPSAVRGAAD